MAIQRLLISARNHPKSPNNTQVTTYIQSNTYSLTVQSAAQQQLMIAPALWQWVLNGQAPLTFLQKMLKPSFSFYIFLFLSEWQTNMKDFRHESCSFIYVVKNSNTTFYRSIGCYDKSDQKVSLSFQQWRHADSRKTR